MKTKRTLYICLCAMLAACLLGGIWLYRNRTIQRDPTQAEIDAAQAYKPASAAQAPSEKEYLLGLCTSQGDVQVGDGQYTGYTSDSLPEILHQCQQILQIVLSQEGELSICYLTTDSKQVILSYDDSGLFELVVYDQEADLMYHEINGTSTVWENFSTGLQFGS